MADERMKVFEYWTLPTVLRLMLTGYVLYHVAYETGIATTVALLGITMALEGLNYSVRMLMVIQAYEWEDRREVQRKTS